MTSLPPDAGAGSQAKKPTTADLHSSKPLAKNGDACLRMTPPGDADLVEQLVNGADNRCL